TAQLSSSRVLPRLWARFSCRPVTPGDAIVPPCEGRRRAQDGTVESIAADRGSCQGRFGLMMRAPPMYAKAAPKRSMRLAQWPHHSASRTLGLIWTGGLRRVRPLGSGPRGSYREISMRNMLALLATAAITFIGLGWYLDWYSVQTTVAPSGH